MSWSFQIGRLFGIPLRVHVTFLLLILLVATAPQGVYGLGRFSSVIFVLALFACVVVHELAHSLVARRYGVPVRYIILLPIGGVALLERMPDDPQQEFNVAVAGPLASLALAVLFGILVFLSAGAFTPLLSPWHGGLLPFFARLAWINIVLAGFNLLPAFPADGGRVLRALLALHMDYAQATHLAATIGQAMAIALGLLGFFQSDWLLIFIAVFIYLGASAEDTQVRVRRTLQEVPAWQAMIHEFRTLSPHDSLAQAFEYASHSYQHDFPIVEEGRLVGLLPRHALIAGMQQYGGEAPVADVMIAQPCLVRPEDSLADVFQQIQTGPCPLAAVVHEGRLMGLITPESVNQYLLSLAYQRRPLT